MFSEIRNILYKKPGQKDIVTNTIQFNTLYFHECKIIKYKSNNYVKKYLFYLILIRLKLFLT